MKKNDFFLILVIAIVVGLFFTFNHFKNNKGDKVVIYVDNKVYHLYYF